MLVRNLQKVGDYKKSILAQDENLRLAIQNDKNVSDAVKRAQKGIKPELTVKQNRIPEQVLTDALEIKTVAMNNLRSIFTEEQAKKFLNGDGRTKALSQDDMEYLNIFWEDLKPVLQSKTGLTLKFFRDILKRSVAGRRANYGFYTGRTTPAKSLVINTQEELLQTFPSINMLREAMKRAATIGQTNPEAGSLTKDLSKLIANFPTGGDKRMLKLPELPPEKQQEYYQRFQDIFKGYDPDIEKWKKAMMKDDMDFVNDIRDLIPEMTDFETNVKQLYEDLMAERKAMVLAPPAEDIEVDEGLAEAEIKDELQDPLPDIKEEVIQQEEKETLPTLPAEPKMIEFKTDEPLETPLEARGESPLAAVEDELMRTRALIVIQSKVRGKQAKEKLAELRQKEKVYQSIIDELAQEIITEEVPKVLTEVEQKRKRLFEGKQYRELDKFYRKYHDKYDIPLGTPLENYQRPEEGFNNVKRLNKMTEEEVVKELRLLPRGKVLATADQALTSAMDELRAEEDKLVSAITTLSNKRRTKKAVAELARLQAARAAVIEKRNQPLAPLTEPLFTPPVRSEYSPDIFNTTPVDIEKGREFMKIEARRQESLDRIAEDYAAKEVSIQAKETEGMAKEEALQRLIQVNLNLQEQAKTKKEQAKLRRESKDLEAQLEADRKERQSQEVQLKALETDRQLKEAAVERKAKKELAKKRKEIEARVIPLEEAFGQVETKNVRIKQPTRFSPLEEAFGQVETKNVRIKQPTRFSPLEEAFGQVETKNLDIRQKAEEAKLARLNAELQTATTKKRRDALNAQFKLQQEEVARRKEEVARRNEEFEAIKAMMQARDAADKLTREREQRAYLDQLAAQSASPTEIEAQIQYIEEISPEIDRYSRDRGSKEVKLTRPKLKQRPRQLTLEDVTTDDPRITARLDSFDSESEAALESMLKFTESELEDQPIGEVANEQDALDKLNLQLDKVALDIALQKKKLSKAPRSAPSKAERDRIRAEAARAAVYLKEALVRNREDTRDMTDLIIEQNRIYKEEQEALAVEEKLSRERQQSLEVELKQGLEQDVRASSEGRRRPTPTPARPLAERQRQRSIGEIKSELLKEDLKQEEINEQKIRLALEQEERDRLAEERASRISETLRSRSASRAERDSRRSADAKLTKKAIEGSRERSESQERARLASEEIARRSRGRSRERIDPSLLKRGISFDSDLIGLSLDDPRLPPEERAKRIEAERIDNIERASRISETLRSRSASRAERDSRRASNEKLTKKAIEGSRERSESQERARLASEEIARRSRGRSRERIDPRFKDRGISFDSDLRPFSLDDPEPRGATEPRSQAKSLIAERISKQAEKDKPRILSRGAISLQSLQSDKMATFQAQQKAAAEGTSSTLALAVASAPMRASLALAEQEAAARDKLLKESRRPERYSEGDAEALIESRRASQITQAKARPTKSFQDKKLEVSLYQKAAREKERGVPFSQSTSKSFRTLLEDPKETENWFRRLQLTSQEQADLGFSRDNFYKSGRGLKAKPKTFIEFGRFKLNENMLEEGVLQVKTANGSPVPAFSKKVAISDTLQTILMDLIETKKLRGVSDLDDEERRMLETLIIKAGLAHGLGVKKVHQSDEDAKKVKRFDLVKGIYEAGNNSVEVIHELRSLILYFIKTKRLNRKDGIEALQELQ